MPVSIKDIAQAADVTPGTVSRALRDSPRVNPDTKRKIQRLADEMGYAPDAQARSLVMGRTQTVGLVVTTISDPFVSSVIQAIESTASDHGYALILASSNDTSERELEAARMLQSRRVDGVIVTSSRVGRFYQEHLERLRVPVVLVNSLVPYSSPHICSLSVDNRHGGYLVTDHLIQKGHRRISYVASPAGRSDDLERMAGYRDALAEAGIAFDPGLVIQGTGRAGGGMRALPLLLALDDPPTAAFCYNDMTALGLIAAACEAGLSLPQDLAIAGFDDITVAQFACPSLTTIAQPVADLGQGAVELVLALLSHDGPHECLNTDQRIRGRLVVRASSG